jgi:hypothetical protein
MKNNIKIYEPSAIGAINPSEIDVISNRIDKDKRGLNDDERKFQNQLQRIQQIGIIREKMNINNFIKSKAEQVIDTDKNINIIILAIIPQKYLEEPDDEIIKRP